VKKIAIIGAGAVGSYYGTMLARGFPEELDVHFLLRSDYEAVRERGIEVLSPRGDFVLHPVKAHRQAEEIGACDLVVVALKATANEVLPSLLPPLLKAETALLTLQNGLGNEEFLAERFGVDRVLGGKCFVCLNRIAPGVIRHIGHGVITLGEFRRTPQERTHELANRFVESGVRCDVCDDIEDVLWRKLVWNIPFNGLSIAAGEVRAGRRIGKDVGQILADSELLERTRKLMQETIAIAAACGVLIPESYIAFQIERTYPMGAYKPSSLLDWEAGREVEIEPIWGEPLRRARRSGVDAPQLDALYKQLLSWSHCI
jgi:2-dehydropantoate 2-reductase